LSGRRIGAGWLRLPAAEGSHVILHRSNPPAWITVPNHRRVKAGTLRGIIRDAGLTVDQFIDLLM
jgi:predicted RNA binding protein YcfA (HicA-like mRNA interferase family)